MHKTIRFKTTDKKISSKDIILVLLGMFVIFILVVSLVRSYRVFLKSNTEIEKAQKKVGSLKSEGEELQRGLDNVKSQSYIDSEFRDKLGLAKPGEIILILPGEDALMEYAPKLDDETELLSDPNWKKWLKLFF